MDSPGYLFIFSFLALVLSSASRSSSSSIPLLSGDGGGNGTELLALLQFKKDIADDPFRVLESWNDSTHLCSWIGVACNCGGRVVALNLTSLCLSGSLSPSLGNLTNLNTLQLARNDLSGEIPPEIGRLKRLEILDLSYNSFTGEIPGSLTNCTNLLTLDLGSNQLSGQIPSNIGDVSKLNRLSFANNSLTGEIPASITNLTDVTLIGLLLNNLQGPIPENIGNLQFLQVFVASKNNLSGVIPPRIFNISSLWYLAVSCNNLSGTFPADLGWQLPNIQTIFLGQNNFQGSIPSSLSNATGLQMISISYNDLTGDVPSHLGNLAGLTYLDLQSNALSNSNDWEFIRSLANCTKLRSLLLSGNYLQGDLPESIGDLSPLLQQLYISGNQITGSIPVQIGNLTNLQVLSMGANNLTGAIPGSLGKLQALQEIVLQNNKLTGLLPSSMGNLSQLSDVLLQQNELEGPIPRELGNLQHLSYIDLSGNRLDQEIPEEIFVFSLQSLYLDNNLLSGSIPDKIGNMQNLQVFIVSNNNLSGEIPATIGDCLVLEFADLNLSRNELSGPIPATLGNLRWLSSLDLSLNHLEGEVPYLGVFQNSSAIEITGNDGLCGGIAELNLPPCPSSSSSSLPTRRKPSSMKTVTTEVLVALCVLWFLLFASYFTCCLLHERESMNEKPCSPSYENYYPDVSYSELSAATDGFSPANLIGAGAHGAVYKGELGPTKTQVAIKVFDLKRRAASKKTFEKELLTLGSIRHRNLVKILMICSSFDSEGKDFKAVVYERIPGGSLDERLHDHVEENKGLSFFQRLSIAVDIAEALQYLHCGCHSPIAHCDLKPSNVLLDSQMTARLTDFGLARFLEEKSTSTSSIGIRGTIGYIAPEFGSGGRPSTRTDVYSYGILVLEMFTGRRPVDEMFKDGLNLRSYVESALPTRALQIVDPRLLENETAINGDAFLISALTVGVLCSRQQPGKRLKMREAAAMMNEMKKAYFRHGESRVRSPSSNDERTLNIEPEVLRQFECDD